MHETQAAPREKVFAMSHSHAALLLFVVVGAGCGGGTAQEAPATPAAASKAADAPEADTPAAGAPAADPAEPSPEEADGGTLAGEPVVNDEEGGRSDEAPTSLKKKPKRAAPKTATSRTGGKKGSGWGRASGNDDGATKLTSVDEAEEQLDEDLQLIQGELSGAVALSDASCGKVCRALDSMGNAVRRLCQLAGDDVARCKRAESKLTKASKRVRGAGCGC
jgi:hypothetical protein